MGKVDLEVKVSHLSNAVTEADLTTFFSYCGTIDEVKLERVEDGSQKAFVTFRQPYAQKIALLLDGAVILDRPVLISSLDDSNASMILPIHDAAAGRKPKNEKQITERSVLKIPVEALKRAREEDAKLFGSDRGRLLGEQATSAIVKAQKSLGNIGSAVLNGSYSSTAGNWVTGILEKAPQLDSVLNGSYSSTASNWLTGILQKAPQLDSVVGKKGK
ncbi:hypothetical protein ACLOJK_023786 [Asimina triloba]